MLSNRWIRTFKRRLKKHNKHTFPRGKHAASGSGVYFNRDNDMLFPPDGDHVLQMNGDVYGNP